MVVTLEGSEAWGGGGGVVCFPQAGVELRAMQEGKSVKSRLKISGGGR